MMKATKAISICSLLLLNFLQAGAIQAESNRSEKYVKTVGSEINHDRERHCDQNTLLVHRPTFEQLECKFLEGLFKIRCGEPPNRERCTRINEIAVEHGVLSKQVAKRATQEGICVFSISIGGRDGQFVSTCPSDYYGCDSEATTIPQNPSLHDLECHRARLRDAKAETWLERLDLNECEQLNRYSAAQGVVSEDVAKQATNAGICIVAPAPLHRILTLVEADFD